MFSPLVNCPEYFAFLARRLPQDKTQSLNKRICRCVGGADVDELVSVLGEDVELLQKRSDVQEHLDDGQALTWTTSFT